MSRSYFRNPGTSRGAGGKKLSLRDAVAIAVAYLRHHTAQVVLGERWEASQPNVSANISFLTPLVEEVLGEFVPPPREAVEAVPGRVCLRDGSSGPCWSWKGHSELWTRTYDRPELPGRHRAGRRCLLRVRSDSGFGPRLGGDESVSHVVILARCL